MAGRVLIPTYDGGGNTTPAYHLAMRLIRRGHDVLMMGWPSMAERAERENIPFASYPSLPPWPSGLPFEHDHFVLFNRMVHGRDAATDILNTIHSYRPDVLLIDCMMGAGFHAALSSGLPTAVLCHLLYTSYRDMRDEGALKGDVEALLSTVNRVLVLVPPGLEEFRELPTGTTYVGPICHPDEADPGRLATWDLGELVQPGPKWVLVSLSTTPMDQQSALRPILEALSSLPVRGLLTLGGMVDPSSITVPDNVIVRHFVPHDFVLPYVDLVVCHGGLSTITASLVAGVPLVCIPQGRDQTRNAIRVEVCGAGCMIVKGSAPAVIASAIEHVLREPSFRASAERIAEGSRPLRRGQEAVEHIEQLMVRAQPTNEETAPRR